MINEFTEEELMKSFHFASDKNRTPHVEILEKARLGWASNHLPYYAEKVCDAFSKPLRIMEMTVGAGVGTNAIVRIMTSDTYYVGVDIDFAQLDSLVKERGFVQADYVPFDKWYIVEYHKLK